MLNFRYHALNIIAVVLFSFVSARTVGQIFRYVYRDEIARRTELQKKSFRRGGRPPEIRRNIDYYREAIVGSGFFKLPSEKEDVPESVDVQPEVSIDDLTLMGTVTGHPSNSLALLKYRRERHPLMAKLWQKVYGYRIVKITHNAVYLRSGDNTEKLGLFDAKKKSRGRRVSSTSRKSRTVKKSISRAEIRQKVMNNLDNAMRGLVVGPYRRNGRIEGFRLKKVRPYNILHKMGLRSGDIVKRINGKKIDSTNKLYSMWNSLKNESRIIVDIERRRKMIQFQFSIHE